MVLTEVWVELKTDDGRVYFWNRSENTRAWALPEGYEVKWIGEKSQDGRTYYWSRKSKDVVWVLPPLEVEKKKEEPKEEPPKGALAALLRGEKPEEEKTEEELKKQQQALQEALLNSLPTSESPPEPQKVETKAEPEKVEAAAQCAAGAQQMAGMGMAMPMDPMQAMMMQMGMGGGMLPGMMMPGAMMPGMMPGLPGMGMSMPSMPMPSMTMPGMAGQGAPTAAPAQVHGQTPQAASLPLEGAQKAEEPYEEHPYLEEEEEECRYSKPPGLPGPKGDSASAIAARHVIEQAGVDTWFLKLPSGEWEEVVRFWPPPEDWDLARPPKLKKKPRLDKWKSRPLALRCQRHEEVVRALLVAQYSSSGNFSAEKYPCPLSNEWCFWGSDGRQILCEEPPEEDGHRKPLNFERNPPEGQRCKLMQNKVRSQMSLIFQSRGLRHLERALQARHRRAQSLAREIPTVPEALKAKLSSVEHAPEPVKVMPSFKAAAPAPAQDAAEAAPAASPDPAAAPWKKRKRGERPGPRTAEPEAKAAESEEPKLKDSLPRKVLVSNVPTTATSKDVLDFFTGAIFTATGHSLPQWRETSKVVEAVELQSGQASVLFATELSASIAVALHGINFQNKVLGIKRPPGFSGPPLNRAKLLTVAMKDLVSDAPRATTAMTSEPQGPGNPSVVKLKGIPSSMTAASVYDCLQQFGGPLKSLSLSANNTTGEHNGSGTAEFVDPASAQEACRFSPFFGFIEVTQDMPDEAARKSRWSQDLGPFEQVLPPDDDLGPFSDILPPKTGPEGVDDELDLGPFNEILRQAAPADDLDLGPFDAILPPR